MHGVDQRGGELGAGRRLPATGPAAREGGGHRHPDAGQQQPRGEQRTAGHEQRGAQRDHTRPGDQRRRGRGEPAHEQVLRGVGVADEPGHEIAGAEPAHRFGVREPRVTRARASASVRSAASWVIRRSR